MSDAKVQELRRRAQEDPTKAAALLHAVRRAYVPQSPTPVHVNPFDVTCHKCGSYVPSQQGQVRADSKGYRTYCVRCWVDTAPAGGAAERAACVPTIRPYQQEGVEWLARRWSCLLSDEMGLGKTLQTLLALPFGARVLIACPVSVRGSWSAETAKWRPDLKANQAKRGRKKGMPFRWPVPGEVLISSYESLPKEIDGAPPPGLILVCDEAQKIKNPRAKLTRNTRRLCASALRSGGRVWILTATPTMNRGVELWNILMAGDLHRTAFGDVETFNSVFVGGDKYGTVDAETAEAFGTAMARVQLARKRINVLHDLPEKDHVERVVEINCEDAANITKQVRMLVAIRLAHGEMQAEGWNVADLGFGSNAEARKRLREELKRRAVVIERTLDQPTGEDIREAIQMADDSKGGVAFTQLSAVRSALSHAKIGALLPEVERYEEAGEPLVVFAAHRAPILTLEGRHGWRVIHGGVSPAQRTHYVEEFQAGKLKGIALTIKAGGTGITLTRAAFALFVDLDWTPAGNSQAEDRIYRIGQERRVQIVRLLADHPADHIVLEVLDRKKALIESMDEAAQAHGVAGHHGAPTALGAQKGVTAEATIGGEQTDLFGGEEEE